VAALGVVAGGVVGAQADPSGNGAVLLGLFAEDALDAERLDGRLEVLLVFCSGLTKPME
jgi:hypothetical protein